MAVRIQIKGKNLVMVRKALARKKKNLDERLEPTARRITLILLSMVTKTFAQAARGNPPGHWPRFAGGQFLSPLTRFIRRHGEGRSSVGGGATPKPLSDKGLLRNSNFPFVRRGGKEFGIANNLRYASLQNFGGISQPNTVGIKKFKRRSKLGNVHSVGPYTMQIGSHRIKARRFFPVKREYMPEIMKLVRKYVKSGARA